MISRSLDALARLCLRYSRQIAIAAVVFAALAIAAASRLTFDPDLLNLIPQKNKQVNEFRKVLADMGTIDYHIVILDIPAGHDVHEYDSLVSNIAEGYRKNGKIADVTYRLPNPLDFVDIVLPRALLFLTPEELRHVEERLSDPGIREAVARNKTLLQTPQAMALKQLIQYDPFNLAPIFIRKFQSAGGGFNLETSSGYYLSADHSTLLILTKPRRPAQDVPFGRQLLEEGRIIEAEALKKFQQSVPAGTAIPKVEHTGGYEIAVSDANLIQQDVIINILGSFFGVLALFLYAFRRGAALTYATLPMILGLLTTFGIAGIAYGTLSSLSAGFAALLAGLGIDFITVFYGRYVDERNDGLPMPQAMLRTIRTTLPGIVVAAITTAATFYAFLATDFRGMTQLGFLTGSGILLFLLAVMFLLPALIIMSERNGAKKAPKLFMHSFGSEHIMRRAIAAPRVTIILWVVFMAACGVLSTRLRFSDNIQDLRAKGNIGVINQAKLTKKFGQSFDFMMYVIEGKTLDEVMQRTQVATADLQPLVRDKTIASFQSISTFIPPREQQLQIIDMLRRGHADGFNAERIRRTFGEALVANGFRPQAYDGYMNLFAQALTSDKPVSIDTLNNTDIEKLAARFVKRANGGWMSVIYVYPTGGRWPREVPPKLMAVADRHPGDVLTGVNLVSATLRRIVRADATRSTIIGIIAVAIIMFASFRRTGAAALTFVPLVGGVVGMLGLMALFDLEFNFMNIFVGLMITGVGTDYAVYMLQRYREDPENFAVNAQDTGKAVVMAALTTVVGYGSFALSHYPGLRSIGYASTFGIGLSGLAAITLLPAILVLLEKPALDREDFD